MTSLQGAVVLVTGANGGLGTEFVHQALERDAAKVYATARTPREWNDERVVPLQLDVTDAASIAAVAASAADTTIVVNNAGASAPSTMLDADLDEVRALFETNVFGPLAVAQAFAPVLTANGGGALVDIHSALSWYAAGNAYSATKAAFWSITNSLRLELAPRGTQVVGVHLGYTDTPMIADLDVPKGRADDIVRRVYEGVEAGEHEILADDTAVWAKSTLSRPVLEQYPQLVDAS
jgi:NAD(P)-dependent dehydrogenase (short-subunit alcohol dehydrogenase family)